MAVDRSFLLMPVLCAYPTVLPTDTTTLALPCPVQVAVTKPLPPDHPLPHAGFSMRGNFVYLSRRADNRVVIGGFR
jgi:glycine/D-amino acid oxidase-like deaminating enzyme